MDPNQQIKNNLGCKELLLRKLSYAVTSSVLSQVTILLVFLFVISFDILRPIQWLHVTFGTVTSLSTWLFVIPFLSIIFAESIVCSKDYVLQPKYCSTRFQRFFTVFSIHNLVLLNLHVLIGGLTVWLFLSLAGRRHGNVFAQCKPEENCLSEETFFLISCEMWIGLYFFLTVHTSDKKILFPVVQQHKLPQFKSRLIPLVKESQRAAVQPTLYYLIFYFFFGVQMWNSCNGFLGLEEQERPSFSPLVYVYAWAFTTLYMFNMNLMRFFIELFLTQYQQFPSDAASITDLTLTEALGISTIPIVQHLAALDLYLLSYNSRLRREMLCTLSQPGNHPHTWNNLIERTLKIISEHTEMLSKATNAILTQEQSSKKIETLPWSPVQSPSKKNYSYQSMRNMSLPSVSSPPDIVTISHNKDLRFPIASESLTQNVSTRLGNILTSLKNKFGYNYLFGELPVIDIQYSLGDGQIIMWITQGLASLAVASLKEDKFGIVQKDVPVIISTLVNLKQSLDRLNRIPALTRKGHGLDDFAINMKTGISSAVKRSLYNICNNFGPYLKDLPLNKDLQQLLHTYISHQNI